LNVNAHNKTPTLAFLAGQGLRYPMCCIRYYRS